MSSSPMSHVGREGDRSVERVREGELELGTSSGEERGEGSPAEGRGGQTRSYRQHRSRCGRREESEKKEILGRR